MSDSEEPPCSTSCADGAGGGCGTGGVGGASICGTGGAARATCSCEDGVCGMEDASASDTCGTGGGVCAASDAFRTLHFGPGSAHSVITPTQIGSIDDLYNTIGPIGLGGPDFPEELADADADEVNYDKGKGPNLNVDTKNTKRVSNLANRIRIFFGGRPRFEAVQLADPHKAHVGGSDFIYDYTHNLTDDFFDFSKQEQDAKQPSAVDEPLVPGGALQGKKEIVAGEVAGGVPSAMAAPLKLPDSMLGQLDAETLAALEAERSWYTLQSRRLSPRRQIPIRPPTPLHIVLAKLNKKGRLRSLFCKKDRLRSLFCKKEIVPTKEREGKVLWSAAWHGPEPGGWACGCPGLPCICYRLPLPPRPIPRGDEVTMRSTGMGGSLPLELSHRLRREYALHRQLRALPPPTPAYLDELRAPLFCVGLEQCFAQREMRPQLVGAAERTRVAAALAAKAQRRGRSRAAKEPPPPPPPPGERLPCSATCQRECYINHPDSEGRPQRIPLNTAAKQLEFRQRAFQYYDPRFWNRGDIPPEYGREKSAATGPAREAAAQDAEWHTAAGRLGRLKGLQELQYAQDPRVPPIPEVPPDPQVPPVPPVPQAPVNNSAPARTDIKFA